jgi:hypothetical protein
MQKEHIMDLNTLSSIVALLVSLSIAAERLVEIVTAPFPFLCQEKADPYQERMRKATLQLLAVIAGVATALLTRPVIQETLPGIEWTLTSTVALGLLVSGGSGFWHSIQGYFNAAKDVRQLTAAEQKQKVTSSQKSIEVALDIKGSGPISVTEPQQKVTSP